MALLERIERAIDAVESLDQDQILRRFLGVVRAMLRTNYFQPAPGGSPKLHVSFKLDPSGLPWLPLPRPALRDLRLLTAHRGRTPARREGGARWDPLVGPARGLPHRGTRPDEGPDGQERGHRAGGSEGRLRGQAPASGQRPRGAAGGGRRLLPDLRPRAARPDRQHRGRRDRAAARRGALRRRRSLPRPRRRQGHRDVLGPRQRDRARGRLLARRRVRLRRLDRLRPQADGHHGARRLGVREAPLPRARPRRPERGPHGGRDRRHVGRRVRQRDAPLAPHPPDRGLQPPRHLPRPRSGPRGEHRGAPPPLRAASLLAGRTTTASASPPAAASSRAARSRSRSRPRCATRSGSRRRR